MSIEVVSERVEALKKDVIRVESTVVGMDKKLDGLGESMLLLARLEERHTAVQVAITANASAIEKLVARVAAIETRLPGLLEVRGWIIAAVLAIVGAVGLTLLQTAFARRTAAAGIVGDSPAGVRLRAGIIDLVTQPATAPPGPTPGLAVLPTERGT